MSFSASVVVASGRKSEHVSAPSGWTVVIEVGKRPLRKARREGEQ